MKLSVEGNKLIVTDVQDSDAGLYNSIPGAKYNKRKYRWEYPRSPFAVARLLHKAKRNGIPTEPTEDVSELEFRSQMDHENSVTAKN